MRWRLNKESSHGLKSVAEGRRRRMSLRDGKAVDSRLSRRDIQPQASQPGISMQGAILAFYLLLLTAPVCAAPPVPAPAVSAPAASAPAAIPDYGGRDSAPLGTGADAPNPAAQAGRAVEALVLVLLGIGGVVYGLKRFGLVQPGLDGKPARITLSALSGRAAVPHPAEAAPVVVEATQTLPGGAVLHLVTVRGRTLLLGATAQSVQTLTEWRDAQAEEDEAQAFGAYLSRADAAVGEAADPASPLSAANARLRSLLDRQNTP